MLLLDKLAIVTGASRGIGKAISIALAREGAKVILADLKKCSETKEIIDEEGFFCKAYQVDISNFEDVKNLIGIIKKGYNRIDILVNNAGIINRTNFLELDEKDWHKVISVNLDGTFYFCKEVIPDMIENGGGKIINITSIAGLIGDITASPVYGTSKGAVNTLTRSLARQFAKYKINVNAVAPHAIETDMSAEWSEEKRKEVIKSIPLGRLGTPEEVASIVVFLASSNSDFITGETININGGFLMH